MAGLKEAKELGPRVDALENELSEVSKKLSVLLKGLSGTNNTLEELLGVVGEIAQQAEPKPDPRIGELMIQMNELREEIKQTAAAIPQPTKKKTTAADIAEDLIISLVIAALLFVFSYTGAKYGGVDDVFTKVEAVGGRVQNVQQRLKDNGFLTEQERQQQAQ